MRGLMQAPIKLIIFCFLLFAPGTLGMGCSTPAMYNSWKGAHISELIKEWGQPDKKVPLEKGGSLLIYNKIPGETRVTYLNNYSPPTKLLGFYSNKKGIIYKWKEKPLVKSLFKK